MRYWRLFILCALLWWGSRVAALEALPLHNDEGLHLTRAVEVWNLHPFWQITDGKIINHWAIALFYPQNAPVFASRMATIFVSLLGFASAYAITHRRYGQRAALVTLALWTTSPYLFFYERMAFSDAEAGALVVLALWAALRLTETWRRRDAILTGLALAAAMLFKFTAVPFAFSIALVVVTLGRASLTTRMRHLVVIGAVVAACFAVPIGYLAVRGDDFFGIALGWLGGGADGNRNLTGNLARLWAQLTDMGTPYWSVIAGLGLVYLAVYRRRLNLVLFAALVVPVMTMILLGSEVLPRHYVVALPLAFVAAGAGLSQLVARLHAPVYRERAALVIVMLLAVGFAPFALQAYRDPGVLPLPDAMRTQYITEHSSGYGLREAVLDLSARAAVDAPIIGSMNPDSCRRANFYAAHGRAMLCTDAPGLPAIEAAHAEYGEVYVVVDNAPNIGIDVATVDANAERIAGYARPGEASGAESVVLWRLTRR